MTMLPVLHSSSSENHTRLPPPGTKALRYGIPALLLAAAGLTVALEASHVPVLAASGSATQDSDNDGLTDLQEEVLATNPDTVDSDGDGYSDLEEICRQSDPRNRFDWPGPNSPKVGLVGRTCGGALTVVSTTYVEGGEIADLGFEFGVVYLGVPIPLDLSYLGTPRISLFTAKNPNDKIVVLESVLPESLIHTLGSLAFYGAHLGDGLSPRFSASALNLTSYGGVVVSLESSPWSLQGGDGIVRRPLAMDDEVPNDWNGGEICWQLTSVVGVNGSSIVYEIEEAACEQMDTFCSPSECEASVGGSIEIVDPGALIGG